MIKRERKGGGRDMKGEGKGGRRGKEIDKEKQSEKEGKRQRGWGWRDICGREGERKRDLWRNIKRERGRQIEREECGRQKERRRGTKGGREREGKNR